MITPEVVELTGETREPGRKISDALRNASKVPAVLYGPKVKENIHFSIDELELEKILSVSKRLIINLEVGGTTYKTLLKKADFHPVSDRAIHVDFYVLDDEHKVTLSVPIRLMGTAIGVTEGGGRVFQPMHILRIRTYPDTIPGEYSVDISELNIGDSIHVSDLDLEGIEALDDGSRTIITVVPPKSEALLTSTLVTEEVADEDEELAEGELAEGEEGAGEGADGEEDAGDGESDENTE